MEEEGAGKSCGHPADGCESRALSGGCPWPRVRHGT